jgi:hypothetical protein
MNKTMSEVVRTPTFSIPLLDLSFSHHDRKHKDELNQSFTSDKSTGHFKNKKEQQDSIQRLHSGGRLSVDYKYKKPTK